MNSARIDLPHELEHSRNQKCKCSKVASPTLAICIVNVMTGLNNQTKS